jgi:hypothetical protein
MLEGHKVRKLGELVHGNPKSVEGTRRREALNEIHGDYLKGRSGDGKRLQQPWVAGPVWLGLQACGAVLDKLPHIKFQSGLEEELLDAHISDWRP